jgi:glycosyltransferase involved in cell wall biosynthesis
MPLISVIIPIFNAAHFLHKAVASVLAQECQQLEIIVVDDGSTDDIDAAVTALPIAVRVVKQPNAGPAAARNTGIRAASGEFIAFLDVDDEWPDRTLDALSAMLVADPSLMLIQGFSQVMVLDTTTGRYEAQGNPADAFPYYIGSALYRREVFDRVGPFDPTLRFGEDWDWFLRFRDSGLPAGRMSRVTLQVHRHGANMTAERTDLEMTATVLPVFKRMLDRKRRSPQTPGASS